MSDRAQIFYLLENIPDELLEEATDWLRIFMSKHGLSDIADDGSFNDKEKQELIRRWEAYAQQPDEGLSLEQLKERMREKYGL